ncbi:MAG TPA: response regulator transcription factor [Candidatus Microbacterium stercoravium]|uniref:Response regulator transcription factor n=1 Tax=Candidatus Microbacterium stercoravium TaxID=2838697 RepID=A0A9D2H5Y9_9MICO|nr:response regulator transcription factor [Candidatus Microbacterium stercoravium]
MTDAVRVLIVDDQHLVRQGIRGLLELSRDVTVADEAADGDEALRAVADCAPDVMLLDLRMPGRDGISTLEELAARGIDLPVLVLTTFDDADLVLRAIRAGARGYLLKDVTLEQLVDGIRTVASGGTLVYPALPPRAAVHKAIGAPGPIDGALTERETQVLRLIAGGYSNREIAEMLHLAPGTVKNHVSNMLMKLGARDRTQAVLRALRHGLLSE